jgi:hypothetical protein
LSHDLFLRLLSMTLSHEVHHSFFIPVHVLLSR